MQVLELIFTKEDGKTVVFSIDKPITPVDAQVVNQVMDTILASSIFSSIDEKYPKKRSPSRRKKCIRSSNYSIK
ncbi:hypothetical protein B1K97_02176 [Bacillus toyonensis]|nr:hypothetical protein B1K97_02176 [Bacillus toyonensis]